MINVVRVEDHRDFRHDAGMAVQPLHFSLAAESTRSGDRTDVGPWSLTEGAFGRGE